MTAKDALKIEVAGGVLTATLNRPAAHNAIDDAIVAGLDAAMDRAEADAAVRVVCLRAEGRTFCGGVDLGHARSAASGDERAGVEDTIRLTGMTARLARLPKPTIAVMQGSAYGAGIGLVVACDIVLAVPEARFATTQVRHGLIPGFIAPFLAHAIGLRRAKRYLLTGERIDAAEAAEIGLIHEVVAADRIEARCAEIVGWLGQGGPESLAGTKRILDSYGPRGLDAAAVRELAELVAAHRRTAEAMEGMSAFKEKRAPAWCVSEAR